MSSNPFSTRFIRPGAIPFVFSDGNSATSVIEQLRRHNWWGQIIGDHGSGKSTLLATLIPLLESAGRQVVSVRLHQGEHRMPSLDRQMIGKNTQLIIDGYEQLSWWSRRRVKSLCRRRGSGLLVTAHSQAGLPTVYRTEPSEALAREVVNRLLADSNALVTPNDVATAFQATGGNLREALFRLYDIHREKSDVCDAIS